VRTYPATARREGKWWGVEVSGVGATQGRSTAEAQRMATDLVAIMEELPLKDINVEIEFELPGELGDEVKRAKQETRAAEQAQRSAAEKDPARCHPYSQHWYVEAGRRTHPGSVPAADQSAGETALTRTQPPAS
jgi:hypothetical protein